MSQELMDPTSLYRWETSSGLEHTCWQCHLKSNNPKARQHCFGIHNIPCIRYHGTMFAIGRAHDCAACITADEVHDGRHREIAILVKEYQSLIKVSDTEETPTRRKGRGLFQNVRNVTDYERPAPQHQRIDPEFSSSTSTSEDKYHITLSKAEQRAYKKATKHEKSLRKSAKNSERHTVSIRQSDIDLVTKALHGDHTDTSTGTGHPLATDQNLEDVIGRNRRFVANIQAHKVYLRTTVRFARQMTNNQRKFRKRRKTAEGGADTTKDDFEELVNAVLFELGIDVSGSTSKRSDRRESFCSTPPARLAAVLQKLKTAIQEDLEKHENEQRQTCIRAGGFWRYVGKPVFDRMTEVARKIDWKTGRIIKEEDVAGEDVIGEIEEQD